MTVNAAERMWSKDNLNLSSPDARRRSIRITRGYTVTCDKEDGIEDILTAEDLPRIGDAFPDSSGIKVTRVNPMQIGPVYYMVIVEYEGEVGPGDSEITDQDPVDTNPTIRWQNLITEEEIDTDAAGQPITTKNHERIRGVTERVTDWVAVIERNYAFGAFDLPTLHEYLRSVNSDIITTNLGNFAPGVARLTKFEPTEMFSEDAQGYIKVNAEVTFRYPYNVEPKDAWSKRVLHEGFYKRVERADETKEIVHAVDANKQRVVRPVLLAEDGTQLDREVEDDTGTADPADLPAAHYLLFETLNRLPYEALGLF